MQSHTVKIEWDPFIGYRDIDEVRKEGLKRLKEAILTYIEANNLYLLDNNIENLEITNRFEVDNLSRPGKIVGVIFKAREKSEDEKYRDQLEYFIDNLNK